MKNYLLPFLFLFSIVIWGQNDPLPRKNRKTHKTIGDFFGKVKSLSSISCKVINDYKGNIIRTTRENYDHEYYYLFNEKLNLKCKTTKNNVISSYKEDYFFDRKIREDRVLDDLDRLFQN